MSWTSSTTGSTLIRHGVEIAKFPDRIFTRDWKLKRKEKEGGSYWAPRRRIVRRSRRRISRARLAIWDPSRRPPSATRTPTGTFWHRCRTLAPRCSRDTRRGTRTRRPCSEPRDRTQPSRKALERKRVPLVSLIFTTFHSVSIRLNGPLTYRSRPRSWRWSTLEKCKRPLSSRIRWRRLPRRIHRSSPRVERRLSSKIVNTENDILEGRKFVDRIRNSVARYAILWRIQEEGWENRGKTSKFARVSHLLHGAKAAAECSDTRWRRDAAGGMRNNTRKSET